METDEPPVTLLLCGLAAVVLSRCACELGERDPSARTDRARLRRWGRRRGVRSVSCGLAPGVGSNPVGFGFGGYNYGGYPLYGYAQYLPAAYDGYGAVGYTPTMPVGLPGGYGSGVGITANLGVRVGAEALLDRVRSGRLADAYPRRCGPLATSLSPPRAADVRRDGPADVGLSAHADPTVGLLR